MVAPQQGKKVIWFESKSLTFCCFYNKSVQVYNNFPRIRANGIKINELKRFYAQFKRNKLGVYYKQVSIHLLNYFKAFVLSKTKLRRSTPTKNRRFEKFNTCYKIASQNF
jgi:hypothetical protein